MKRILLFLPVMLFVVPVLSQDKWTASPPKIRTQWTAEMNPSAPLPEYPRPQLVRSGWMNLNGRWDYAIVPKGEKAEFPVAAEGEIVVPFAVESALSGVGRRVGEDSVIWYRRQIELPSSYKKNKILLHFGAVDWQCEVFINGQKAGMHEGGYDPFYFDITDLVKKSGPQTITVKVWDPTDKGPQARGKQVTHPEGIWYTPVTGIWQTVWIEPVPLSYIVSTKHDADIDNQRLSVAVNTENKMDGDQIKITAFDGPEKIAEEVTNDTHVNLPIQHPKLWSPDNPHLYGLEIAIIRKGKVIDKVSSYFAMRKISLANDAAGTKRMMLNNHFVFQYGPLDQGWWPDGLYTAPTDAALMFDIEKTKEMGFNMIRKHVKVEPARWYYYCDSIGMLVWQDMPSGDLGNRWDSRPGIVGIATEQQRTAESEKAFRTEWKEIIDDLYNFPSIVVWTPFNEAWGQFKTDEIVSFTRSLDSGRLINTASGGNFHETGDIIDLHNYPDPAMPRADIFGKDRAVVLGEFGGLGLPLKGHTWQDEKNWGYQTFKNEEELYKRYSEFIHRLPAFIQQGLSAAVYTQTTDVEGEVNGLMTYDREVMKMPVDELNKLHKILYDEKLVVFPK